MKNRDKLNAMSNEELAKRLGCQCCIYLKKKGSGTGPACTAPFGDEEPFCHKGVTKWLESEVEDER